MKRIISLFLCLILLLSVTGCGGSDYGKRDLSIAIPGPPMTMDVQMITDVSSGRITSLFAGTLFRYNKEDDLELYLAKSYERSADGLKYTFRLRDGLKWSDGRSLTAKDFVYGMRRLADPDTGSNAIYLITDSCVIKNVKKVAGGEMEPEELGVSAPDDMTVVYELESPCPYFESLLSTITFAPCNEEFVRECGDAYAISDDELLSCGPYMVDSYEPLSTQIHLVRNPYSIDDSDTYPEEINIQVVPNAQQAIMCYDTGQFDVVNISSTMMDFVKDHPDLKTIETANYAYLQIGDRGDTPIDNIHIRRAISLSIDRESIVRDLLKAGAEPCGRINPKGYYKETDGTDFSKDDDRYSDVASYDPETARSEWKTGLSEINASTVELDLSYNSTSSALCEVIKQQCEKTLDGLTINLVPLQVKEYYATKAKSQYDLTLSIWVADYADPNTFFMCYISGANGEKGYSNTEVDKLLAKSLSKELVSDPGKRNQILHQTEDALMQDVASVPLYSMKEAFLTNSMYSDYDLTPTGIMYLIGGLERRS